jgi:hypothetical protein
MGKLGAVFVAALVFAGCSGGSSVTNTGNGNGGDDAGTVTDGGVVVTPPIVDGGTTTIPIPPEPDGGTTTTPPPSDAGTTGMTPGSLGAGPWPAGNVSYGAADGIQETPIIGMTTDETQNIWVATQSALYLMRPGDTSFTRFDASAGLHLPGNPTPNCYDWTNNINKNGLSDNCEDTSAESPGISEIEGGGPNEVFVGYWGLHLDNLGLISNSGDASLPDGTPVDGTKLDPARHSGKLDRVRLQTTGSLEVVRLDLLSSDEVSFWHNRDVERMVYDHFIKRHELYVGLDHGIDKLTPDNWSEPTTWFLNSYQSWMADHLHPQVCFHAPCAVSSTQMLGDWRGLAIDSNGDLWTGGRWAAGKIRYTDLFYNDSNGNLVQDWYRSPRKGDGQNAINPAFGDGYTSDLCGLAPSAPVFCPPQEGDPVNISAVTLTPDGKVWFASGTLFNESNDVPYGIAYFADNHFTYFSASSVGLGEADVRDMVALPDGRLVIAGISTGLVIWNPADNTHVNIHAGQGIPSDRIYRMELDTMVSPPVLHVATANGAASIRVFPQ